MNLLGYEATKVNHEEPPAQFRKKIYSPLTRFIHLDDKQNTSVFTFIILPELIRGYIDELETLPFTYGQSLWKILFERREPHLGIFLESCNFKDESNQSQNIASRFMLDFSFSVENREHFSRNETFELKRIEFNEEQPCVGRKSLIELADLSARKFLFDDGRCLIKLVMKNLSTFLRVDLRPAVDPAVKGPFGYKTNPQDNSQRVQVFTSSGSSFEVLRKSYFESETIHFAKIFWKYGISFSLDTRHIKTPSIQANQIVLNLEINLLRLKVRKEQNIWYKVNLCIELPGGISTGPLGFLIGPQGYPMRASKITIPKLGTSNSVPPPDEVQSILNLCKACNGQELKTKLTILDITPTSIIEIPLSKMPMKKREMVVLIDPDGDEWLIHGESGGKLLRIGLLPKPPSKNNPKILPFGHMKKSGLLLKILPSSKQSQNPSTPVRTQISQINKNIQTWLIDQEYTIIDRNGQPDLEYLNYDANNRGFENFMRPDCIDSLDLAKEAITSGQVAMNIPFDQIANVNEGYLNPETGRITIQIEWIYSYLLLFNKFHRFDEISSLHLYQMRHEIIKLQAENQELEKQLVVLQISKNNQLDMKNPKASDVCYRSSSQIKLSQTDQHSRRSHNDLYEPNARHKTSASGFPNNNRNNTMQTPRDYQKQMNASRNYYGARGDTFGDQYQSDYEESEYSNGPRQHPRHQTENSSEKYRSWNNYISEPYSSEMYQRELSPTASYKSINNINKTCASGYYSDKERGRYMERR